MIRCAFFFGASRGVGFNAKKKKKHTEIAKSFLYAVQSYTCARVHVVVVVVVILPLIPVAVFVF